MRPAVCSSKRGVVSFRSAERRAQAGDCRTRSLSDRIKNLSYMVPVATD